MSEAYDSSMRSVRDWRDSVTRGICRMIKDGVNTDEIAGLIDSLNKAWEKLTEIQRRQIEERDGVVIRLMNELAERKPR